MDLNQIKEKMEFFNSTDFKFFEEEHVYTYNKKRLKSVTKFIEQFHLEFPTEVASQKAAIRDGITVAEVLENWRVSNVYSCLLGHKVHKYIEDYYGDDTTPEVDLLDEDMTRRVSCFLDEIAPRLEGMVPIAQELRIFSERMGLAGTIDALFLRGNDLYMLDWKTNKDFGTDQTKAWKYLLPPFQAYYENEHNKYSIQLSTYKLILAEQGIYVKDCALIHLPREGTGAHIYKAKPFCPLLEAYFGVDFVTKLEQKQQVG